MKYGGWFRESYRHSLAARGFSTYSKKRSKADIYGIQFSYDAPKAEMKRAGKQDSVQGIPIIAEPIREGRIYPISPDEVKKVMARMPEKDLKGVVAIEFVNPKGEQKDAWAQYVRSTRKVLVFSQPLDSDGTIDGQNPEHLKKHIELYVLPHEIGHHKALYQAKITDRDLNMAEARADANVIGMAPDDKDVKMLKV